MLLTLYVLITLSLFSIAAIILFGQRVYERLRYLHHLKENVLEKLNEHRARFDERQLEALKILQDTLQKGIQDTRFSVKEALTDYANDLGKRVETLTQT